MLISKSHQKAKLSLAIYTLTHQFTVKICIFEYIFTVNIASRNDKPDHKRQN